MANTKRKTPYAAPQKQQNRQRKTRAAAYILWAVFGIFGAHRFYLNRYQSATAMLIITLTGIGLAITAVWWIIDAFLLPQILREEQAKLSHIRQK